MTLRPISVSQLNDYISRLFSTDLLLNNVNVVGEISNLKFHQNGHVYFSISDSGAKVNCVMFNNIYNACRFELKDGLEVTIQGKINLYKKGGSYSLVVSRLDVNGAGNLAQAFQIMKEKLEKEGLFDQAHKKPIPTFPKTIGVVTSATGAAVEDIKKIILSRNNYVDILVFPVLVQGELAARDIANRIAFINENYPAIDTLIVGRGGGSQEDLWAFNEEVLAHAIYDSKIPIISAVGHEIDFSISDFVADRRAETPTAAAEMAVPDISEIKRMLEKNKDSLKNDLIKKVKYEELLISQYLRDMKADLDDRLKQSEHRLERLKLMLEENNPQKVLEKGFSIISNDTGKNVTSKTDFKLGEVYEVRFKDGSVKFKAEKA